MILKNNSLETEIKSLISKADQVLKRLFDSRFELTKDLKLDEFFKRCGLMNLQEQQALHKLFGSVVCKKDWDREMLKFAPAKLDQNQLVVLDYERGT